MVGVRERRPIERKRHEVWPSVRRLESCRLLDAEAEACVERGISEHEDGLPSFPSRSREPLTDQIARDAFAAAAGLHRYGSETERLHGRGHRREKDVAHHLLAVHRNERNRNVAVVAQTIDQIRFGGRGKRAQRQASNAGAMGGLLGLDAHYATPARHGARGRTTRGLSCGRGAGAPPREWRAGPRCSPRDPN